MSNKFIKHSRLYITTQTFRVDLTSLVVDLTSSAVGELAYTATEYHHRERYLGRLVIVAGELCLHHHGSSPRVVPRPSSCRRQRVVPTTSIKSIR